VKVCFKADYRANAEPTPSLCQGDRRSQRYPVVVPFPKGAARVVSRRSHLEQENADLRRYVVDLALQIQELKSAKD
jgi:hypothetical protein